MSPQMISPTATATPMVDERHALHHVLGTPVASASPVGSFRVRVLGPLSVERDGYRLSTTAWQPRVASLFTMLVVAPHHQRLRDEVLDYFWPDASSSLAAANLRVLVHRLRCALGGGTPSPVLTDYPWIGLNEAYQWDVDAQTFLQRADDAHLERHHLEEVLALARGEPLPEFRYEDWAIPIRSRIERVKRDLLIRLATHAAHEGDSASAEAGLEELLRRDPLDETALQHLLMLLQADGCHRQALRRYQQFERELMQELGLVPSEQTRALFQGLQPQRFEMGTRGGAVRALASSQAGSAGRSHMWRSGL